MANWHNTPKYSQASLREAIASWRKTERERERQPENLAFHKKRKAQYEKRHGKGSYAKWRQAAIRELAQSIEDVKFYSRGKKSNPMRHFPTLPGRGRPEKVREIEMTTIMADGRAAQKTLIATKSKAYAQARRVLAKGIQGRPVRQILVEDKKVVRGKKARKSAKR